jgi:hypothetical protein
MRYQVLVLDSELEELPAGVELTEFQFQSSSACSGDEFYKLEIKVCHSSKTILGNNPSDNYTGNTPALLHTNDKFTSNFSVGEWFGFEFSEPFIYDGESSVVFEVRYNGNNGGSIMCSYDQNNGRTLEARTMNGNGSLQGMTPVRIYYKDNTGTIKHVQINPVSHTKVFPNPSSGLTTINFNLNKISNVSVQVFDSKGSLVKIITHDTQRKPGNYSLNWDGRNAHGEQVASGVYIIEIINNNIAVRQRVICQ